MSLLYDNARMSCELNRLSESSESGVLTLNENNKKSTRKKGFHIRAYNSCCWGLYRFIRSFCGSSPVSNTSICGTTSVIYLDSGL